MDNRDITQKPKSPDYIRGVINFRGNILPVIETRIKFNMPQRDQSCKYVIIVLDLTKNNKKMQLGAIADGVKDVLEISEDKIIDVPEMGSNYNMDFVRGMIKQKDNFIMILDIDKVFFEENIEITETVDKSE